jgi:parallel beta-helix repeat protein
MPDKPPILAGCSGVTVNSMNATLMDGIFIEFSNNTMLNNSLIMNSSYGVFIQGSDNITVDNISAYNLYYGFSINSTNSRYSRIRIDNSTQYGIRVYGNGNNLSSIFISNTTATFGSIVVTGINHNLTNLTLLDSGIGIRLGQLTRTDIRNSLILGNDNGIYSDGDFNDTRIIDSNITSDVYDVNYQSWSTNKMNLTMVNTSFRLSNLSLFFCISVGDVCAVNVVRYADVQVNYTNGTPGIGLIVSGYNVTNVLHDSRATDSSGKARLLLTDTHIWSDQVGPGNYYIINNSNFTVNVTDGILFANASANMSANRMINLTLIVASTNTAPIINQTNLTPVPAYRNSTMNCSAFALDNQSSSLNVTFIWFINSTLNTSLNTTVSCSNNTWCYANTTPSGFLKNYTITCSARSLDGINSSSWVNSSSVRINDSPAYIWSSAGVRTECHLVSQCV